MDVLELIFWVELAILGMAGILGLVGMMIGKQNPDDPIYLFTSAFWREFLWPPVETAAARGSSSRGGGGRSSGSGGSSRPQQVSDDDETYGRIMKNAEGTIDKIELAVLVEPHASTDEVVGRDGDGLKIRVTGEPGEGRANKAIIELVANAVGVKPYQVNLTKGHYQTLKAVTIQGMTEEELQAKLELMNEA